MQLLTAPSAGWASGVQVGDVTSCNPDGAGTLRYRDDLLEVCDGTDWIAAAAGPPTLSSEGDLGTVLAQQSLSPIDLGAQSEDDGFTCSVVSGALPNGVSLGASTCVLTGTPSNPGSDVTASFSVRVTDRFGSDEAAYTLTVDGITAQVDAYPSPGSFSFVVPQGTTSITVKSWGAGGGGGRGNSPGGGGGYAGATFSVTPGETLQIRVGGGGGSWAAGGAAGINGGGRGGLRSGIRAGGGGGYSGLFRGSVSQGGAWVVAGGGGGGGTNGSSVSGWAGGPGGGGSGTSGGCGNTLGATSSGPGGSNAGGGGPFGSALQGGAGAGNNETWPGGGGGGGYWGGGGGWTGGGSGCNGGGGSGFVRTGGSTSTGSGRTPANSGDGDRSGAGLGAPNGGTGGNGRVVLRYSGY